MKKGTFVFKSFHHIAHWWDLRSHDSKDDSGVFENYYRDLEAKGLAQVYREPKIVFIIDIRKHYIPYKDTYITPEFMNISEKDGKELGWVSKSDLIKLKKKK